MRILQIIQKPQLRGAEIFASQLSNHLLALGHDVRMVSLYDGPSDLPFTGTFVRLNRPIARRFIDFEGWRILARIISDFKADIVQANAGDTLKFAVSSRFIFRWKSCLIFRNANKVSDFIDSYPKLLLNSFFVRRVNHVISVSELCRQDFIRTYSYPDVSTITIPIGIELSNDRQGIQGDLGVDITDAKIALSVGSLVPEKNHMAIVRIAQRLGAQSKIRFLVVGHGKLWDELVARIDQAGLAEKVVLAGYRKDVPAIMRHASVLAMPSLIEGLPAVILEAFYSKIPVVAYDVGGISEVVRNGETGWLVKKNDEQGFLRAVEEAINDTPEVRAIITKAFLLVTEHYSNKSVAQRFSVTYERIVGK